MGARFIGARKATGDVLVFLDALCERGESDALMVFYGTPSRRGWWALASCVLGRLLATMCEFPSMLTVR